MELPTYTNIWRIEKRLYKLYDFRLPMPLPVGQVAAFLAIAIPYMLILTMAGMPFSHTWVWLYVLPPGVLAWLVTRPVLEGKRLPELVVSQLRYLSEPRTWCRMAPLAERDQIFVTARVWRGSAVGASLALTSDEAADSALMGGLHGDTERVEAPRAEALRAEALRVDAARADTTAAASGAVDGESTLAQAEPAAPIRPVWPTRPAIASRRSLTPAPRAAHPPADPTPVRARATGTSAARTAAVAASSADLAPAAPPPPAQAPAPAVPLTRAPAPAVPAGQAPVAQKPAAQKPAAQNPAASAERPPVAPVGPRPLGRPTVTVHSDGNPARPLPVVERALRSSPGADGWHERVVVVSGGHRPGKPDQVQRDQARARLPLLGPVRIVVLGCTAGAGQTTTTLLTGQLLTTLRAEAVAVLDIGSGPGSLTEQARQIPRLLPNHRDVGDAAAAGRERGLQVVTADPPADQPADAGRLIEAVVTRYRITVADPAAAHVPRAVHVADQLVLVAPASADAAGSLAMTLEWLEAHGDADLVRSAVTVLNGVSAPMAAHVDKAAGVAAGRCRAIVRVPWDDGFAGGPALGTATIHAYTALAGVLVAGLAESASAPGAPIESSRR